jgi:uncharacterized protein (TIGR03067 family)
MPRRPSINRLQRKGANCEQEETEGTEAKEALCSLCSAKRRFSMWLTFAFLLTSAAVCGDEPPKQAAVPRDPASLQGTWTVAYGERDGKRMPQDELVNLKLVLVFKGNSVAISSADGEAKKYSMSTDPVQNPKAIDLYSTRIIGICREGDREVRREITGKFLDRVGIYAVEGKTLTLCFGQVQDRERPTEFVTKGKAGRELYILNREE